MLGLDALHEQMMAGYLQHGTAVNIDGRQVKWSGAASKEFGLEIKEVIDGKPRFFLATTDKGQPVLIETNGMQVGNKGAVTDPRLLGQLRRNLEGIIPSIQNDLRQIKDNSMTADLQRLYRAHGLDFTTGQTIGTPVYAATPAPARGVSGTMSVEKIVAAQTGTDNRLYDIYRAHAAGADQRKDSSGFTKDATVGDVTYDWYIYEGYKNGHDSLIFVKDPKNPSKVFAGALGKNGKIIEHIRQISIGPEENAAGQSSGAMDHEETKRAISILNAVWNSDKVSTDTVSLRAALEKVEEPKSEPGLTIESPKGKGLGRRSALDYRRAFPASHREKNPPIKSAVSKPNAQTVKPSSADQPHGTRQAAGKTSKSDPWGEKGWAGKAFTPST
jgi:hypothetical protein